MLIRQQTLQAIAAGTVNCAFRRWERPTVKTGGTLQTAVGLLRIDGVTPVPLASISAAEARQAGYASKEELLAELAVRKAGTVYRIDLHLAGPDPRVALRGKAALTAAEIAALRIKPDRLDAASRHGPWTQRALAIIQAKPKQRAADLALELDLPKDWLKISIRKLKNLGLTISHEPGYELSSRGKRLLRELKG